MSGVDLAVIDTRDGETGPVTKMTSVESLHTNGTSVPGMYEEGSIMDIPKGKQLDANSPCSVKGNQTTEQPLGELDGNVENCKVSDSVCVQMNGSTTDDIVSSDIHEESSLIDDQAACKDDAQDVTVNNNKTTSICTDDSSPPQSSVSVANTHLDQSNDLCSRSPDASCQSNSSHTSDTHRASCEENSTSSFGNIESKGDDDNEIVNENDNDVKGLSPECTDNGPSVNESVSSPSIDSACKTSSHVPDPSSSSSSEISSSPKISSSPSSPSNLCSNSPNTNPCSSLPQESSASTSDIAIPERELCSVEDVSTDDPSSPSSQTAGSNNKIGHISILAFRPKKPLSGKDISTKMASGCNLNVKNEQVEDKTSGDDGSKEVDVNNELSNVNIVQNENTDSGVTDDSGTDLVKDTDGDVDDCGGDDDVKKGEQTMLDSEKVVEGDGKKDISSIEVLECFSMSEERYTEQDEDKDGELELSCVNEDNDKADGAEPVGSEDAILLGVEETEAKLDGSDEMECESDGLGTNMESGQDVGCDEDLQQSDNVIDEVPNECDKKVEEDVENCDVGDLGINECGQENDKDVNSVCGNVEEDGIEKMDVDDAKPETANVDTKMDEVDMENELLSAEAVDDGSEKNEPMSNEEKAVEEDLLCNEVNEGDKNNETGPKHEEMPGDDLLERNSTDDVDKMEQNSVGEKDEGGDMLETKAIDDTESEKSEPVLLDKTLKDNDLPETETVEEKEPALLTCSVDTTESAEHSEREKEEDEIPDVKKLKLEDSSSSSDTKVQLQDEIKKVEIKDDKSIGDEVKEQSLEPKSEKLSFKNILKSGKDDALGKDEKLICDDDDDVIVLEEDGEDAKSSHKDSKGSAGKAAVSADLRKDLNSEGKSGTNQCEENRKRSISFDDSANVSSKRTRLDSAVTAKSDQVVTSIPDNDAVVLMDSDKEDSREATPNVPSKPTEEDPVKKPDFALTTAALRGLIMSSLKVAIWSHKLEKTQELEERMSKMEAANMLWKESAKHLEKSVEELTKVSKDMERRRSHSQRLKLQNSRSVGLQVCLMNPNQVAQRQQILQQVQQKQQLQLQQQQQQPAPSQPVQAATRSPSNQPPASKPSPNPQHRSATLSLPPSVLLHNGTQAAQSTPPQPSMPLRGAHPGQRPQMRPNMPTAHQQMRPGTKPGSYNANGAIRQRLQTLQPNSTWNPPQPPPQAYQPRPSGVSPTSTTGGGTRPGPSQPRPPQQSPSITSNTGVIDLTDEDDVSRQPRNINANQIPGNRPNAVRGPNPNQVVRPQQPNKMVPSQAGIIQQQNLIANGQVNSSRPNSQAGYIARPGGPTTTRAGAVAPRQTNATNSVQQPNPSSHSSQKHPAPFPTESNVVIIAKNAKMIPPKPSLKLSRVLNGIVLSWNMPNLKNVETIASYQLFAYQETGIPPTSSSWKKVGNVKALPLPMACTLTQFQEGNKYYFAVRAVDRFGRWGEYSEPSSIYLYPEGSGVPESSGVSA